MLHKLLNKVVLRLEQENNRWTNECNFFMYHEYVLKGNGYIICFCHETILVINVTIYITLF